MPLVLPAGLVTQLNNVANAAGVSPFMALLAVWQVREGNLQAHGVPICSESFICCCTHVSSAAELASFVPVSSSMLDPAVQTKQISKAAEKSSLAHFAINHMLLISRIQPSHAAAAERLQPD